MLRRWVARCAVIVLGWAGCALAAERGDVEFPGQVDSVSVRLERAGPMVLLAPVQINGQDCGLFLVDTGASSIIVDRKLPEKLGLAKVGAGKMQVLGGKSTTEEFAISSASVGGVKIGGTFITTQDLSGWRERFAERFNGILGNDFLGRMPFTLDHRQATLVLHDPKKFTPPATPAQRLVMSKHDPGIRVRVEDEVDEWFVLDSGSDVSIYFRPHLVTLHQAWALRKPFHPRPTLGFAGAVLTSVAQAERVELLGHDFSGVDLSYALNSEGEFPSTVGHVGMGLLRRFRLTLDYAGGRIWAEAVGELPPAEWEAADFDVNKGDAAGMTPLMRAAEMGRGDDVKRFLAAGADVNAKEKAGRTALHFAAKRGDVAVIRSLLSAGATAGAKSKSDETPLMLAASDGSAEAVGVLLDAKASVDDEDVFGRTALIFATEQRDGQAVQLLLKAGAKVDVVSRAAGSALFEAAILGNSEAVEALLKAGADPNVKQSPDGSTPLGVAAHRGWEGIVRMLLEGGAKVDGQSRARQTPLHLAARAGHVAVVGMLLDAGASRGALDGEGKSPFERASEGGHLAVMRMLYESPTSQPAGAR